ncbi:helix-turn-helix transcriptional regulator [Actinomadura sp. WMMB 499]|uniref:helix-turn-helix transcriptional regulator n=1 Tax=Actinomadura sp. WMMB 499 TaxID=1219491 RepID=UPI001248016C|nr:AraC family transcriptional regulator [Actinomadura sp. WMMB 499]QFG23999.1 helix-turn-helix transcriptional regulator [Actinomadura sp. WMMB 499]
MPAWSHDPEDREEYGYGLGAPNGVLVLKYRSSGGIDFGRSRQDFLHQLYWSPDGPLGTSQGFITAPVEAYWVRRTVDHEVRAGDRQTVYRICLREVPAGLAGLRAGPVPIDGETARLIERLARRDCDEAAALAARRRIVAGLGAPPGRGPSGTGIALTVARALSRDPADQTRLDEWAERLRVSVKTLQRDFVREFGMPYTRWRTQLRLRSARVLLCFTPVTQVAPLVGYASPSAFITAFTKEYGHTPGVRAPQA